MKQARKWLAMLLVVIMAFSLVQYGGSNATAQETEEMTETAVEAVAAKEDEPKAEVPKAEKSEEKESETEAPKEVKEEKEAPETEAPETKAPETKAAETEATKAPETEAAVATEAPKADEPETEAAAPETEAAATEAAPAETEATVTEAAPAETEAPETTAAPAETAAETEAPKADETPAVEPTEAESEAETVIEETEEVETKEVTEAEIEEETETEEETEEEITTVEQEKKVGKATVKVSYPSDAFDEEVTFQVKLIQNEKVYNRAYDKLNEMAEADQTTYTGAIAFDISFLNEAKKEIEPKKEVSVSIRLDDSQIPRGTENITMVHEKDNGKLDIIEDIKTNKDLSEVSFDADSFSTYEIWFGESINLGNPLKIALSGSDTEVAHNKKIKKNDNGTYTLTLDVTGKADMETNKAMIDVLLIIDESGSMADESQQHPTGNGMMSALKSVIPQLSNSILNNDNFDARMAMVTFSGTSEDEGGHWEGNWWNGHWEYRDPWNDAKIRASWTDNKNTIDQALSGVNGNGGTNAEAGLRAGAEVLESARTEAQKFVIFLSDGDPTYYYTEEGITKGTGNSDAGGTCASQALQQAASITGLSGFYTVGLSNAAPEKFLSDLRDAVTAGKKGHYSASNSNGLIQAFNEIQASITEFLCTNVMITDKLSIYADMVNEDNPQFTIKATKADGTAADLPSGIKATYDKENRTVTLDFPDNYELKEGITYSVSFDVKPSQAAYEALMKSDGAYPDKGEEGTGDGANQPGFYSNEDATVTWEYKASMGTAEYKHPVVQVDLGSIGFEKVDKKGTALAGAVFTLYSEDGVTEITREGNQPITATSGSDGQVKFDNIAPGNYTVKETSVPEGYVQLEDSYSVTVEAGKSAALNGIADNKLVNKKAVGSLQIAKTVEGSATDKAFSFTVTLTDEEGKTLEGQFAYTKSDGAKGFLENGASIVLKNGETVTITDLPVGTQYKVEETGASGFESNSTGETGTIVQNVVSKASFTNTYQPGTTSISGNKTWIGVPEGSLYPEVTVELYRNDSKIDETKIENGAGTYSFDNLPRYDENGDEYRYSVKELPIAGYTQNQVGNHFINTYTGGEILTKTVKKQWVDVPAGSKHPEITFTLYQNGEVKDTYVLKDGESSHTFTGLPTYDTTGKKFQYSIKESSVNGYEQQIEDTEDGWTVTNTYTGGEKTSIEGDKTWVNLPNDMTAPDITITLSRGGEKYDSYLLTNGETHYEFTDLDTYDPEGNLYKYTVSESAINGYTMEQNGYDFTNTYAPEKISVSGTKRWENVLDNFPDAIIVLKQNGLEYGRAELKDGATSYTFTGLPEYDAKGEKYEYTVEELPINGYSQTDDGMGNFTNTYTGGDKKISISGKKNWVGLPVGSVYPTVEITLYQNGKPYGSPYKLENGADSYQFVNLPQYDTNGEEYKYTVSESEVNGYTQEMTPNEYGGWDFTNTYTGGELTKIGGTKTWVALPEGTTPPDITIRLFRNEMPFDYIILTNGAKDYLFDNLPTYDTEGNKYSYTVKEDSIPGYTTEQTGDNFINTYTPGTINIEGQKTWVGVGNNKYPVAEVILYQNDVEYKRTQITNGAEGYSFTGLPEVDTKGKKYEYRVEEVPINGYEQVVSENGLDFTNTYMGGDDVTVEGTKTWNVPAGSAYPDVEITLYQNGITYGTSYILKNGESSYRFDHLPKYDTEGKEYNYTVEESSVNGYTQTKDGWNFTNTYTGDTTEVSGRKEWAGVPEGTIVPDVTIQLFRDGEYYDSRTLTNGTTEYVFDHLKKYDTLGREYQYTVKEDPVDGYTSVKSGTNFTNTYTPGSISISGKKIWKNVGNAAYPTVTIILYRDGEVYASTTIEKGAAGYSFTGLEEYRADGTKYEYTVEEVPIDGYEQSMDHNGRDFTNTYTGGEEVTVEGTKTWNVPEGSKYPEVTITLYQNDSVYGTYELKDGARAYKFTNLPKYDTLGHEYIYTVSESQVNGYEQSLDNNGRDFTNTYTGGTTEIRGTKTWENLPQGTTPPDITIKLSQNGVDYKSLVLKNGETDYVFDNLPIYDTEGNLYVYAVSEIAIDGYTSKQDGNNFVNTYTPGTISIGGNKIWENVGNGEYPVAEIILKQNGEVYKTTTIENGATSYSFTGLPEYDTNGQKYKYTVEEVAINGYEQSADNTGLNLTNTYTGDVTDVSGTKTWTGVPKKGDYPTVTITLYRDGEAYDTFEIKDGGESYRFENLLKYDTTGREYVYTVEESVVNGYEQAFAENGRDLTNTYLGNPGNIPVQKVWNDQSDRAGLRPESVTLQLQSNVDMSWYQEEEKGLLARIIDFFTGGAEAAAEDGWYDYGEVVTLTAANASAADANIWQYTFENLPTVDTTGAEVKWRVIETSEDANYTVSYGDDGRTVINTHDPAVNSITVTKTQMLMDNNGLADVPEAVAGTYYFAVFNENKEKVSDVQSITFDKGGEASKAITFDGLVDGIYYVYETDADGNPYENYSQHDGYSTWYVNDGAAVELSAEDSNQNVAIYNVFGADSFAFSGSITVTKSISYGEDGNGLSEDYTNVPKTFYFGVYDGDTLLKTATLEYSDTNRSVPFTDLPAEVSKTYTIKELDSADPLTAQPVNSSAQDLGFRAESDSVDVTLTTAAQTGEAEIINVMTRRNPATEPTEPVPTDPEPTEPAPTEPAPTDPEPTEPAPTEPAPTDPAPENPTPGTPEPIPTIPEPATGSIQVTKNVADTNGAAAALTADRTFYVALFADAAHTNRVSDVQALNVTAGSSSAVVTFSGLAAGSYYVAETNAEGAALANDGTQDFIPVNPMEASVITAEAANVEASITNLMLGADDQLAQLATIELTKHVSYADGVAAADYTDAQRTFYFAVYDANGEVVTTESVAFGSSEETKNLTITDLPVADDGTTAYTVREVDANGNPVDEADVPFTVDNASADVEFDAQNRSAEVEFTNTFGAAEDEDDTETMEEEETETTEEDPTEEITEEEDSTEEITEEAGEDETEDADNETTEEETTEEETESRRGPVATGLNTHGGLFAGTGLAALLALALVLYLRRRQRNN